MNYNLPNSVVEWPYLARYDVIQNVDTIPGVFKIHYVLSTANKAMAEKLNGQPAITDEEKTQLDARSVEGDQTIILQPNDIKAIISPPNGLILTPDRIFYDHSVVITGTAQ